MEGGRGACMYKIYGEEREGNMLNVSIKELF